MSLKSRLSMMLEIAVKTRLLFWPVQQKILPHHYETYKLFSKDVVKICLFCIKQIWTVISQFEWAWHFWSQQSLWYLETGAAGGVKTGLLKEMRWLAWTDPSHITREEQNSILYQITVTIQPFKCKVLRGNQITFFMWACVCMF